jgi:O-Antigen ligase/Tetratricopeptide repeat
VVVLGRSASRLWGGVLACGVAVSVTTIGFAHGGYFPSEWGWALLGFTLACLFAVLARDGIALGPLELAMVVLLFVFAGWTVLSTVWSVSAAQPVLSGERVLVYPAAMLAAFLAARSRRDAPALVAGVLAAAVVVCGYAILTRVFPGSLVAYPPADGYQLQEPIGYWNGLAIIATIGVLASLGFAAEARGRWSRALAVGALPLLLVALYLTFSRGGWLALAAGLCVSISLSVHRLHLLAVFVACMAIPVFLLWSVSHLHALTREGSSLEAARSAGWELGLAVLVSSLATAAVGACLQDLESRMHVSPRVQHRLGVAMIVLVVVGVSGVMAHAGGPAVLAHRFSASFNRSLPPAGGDLGQRLTSLSSDGRTDYWRVAWQEVRANPWLGAGAGSFERYWHLERPTSYEAQNAHNLYLETLAELGPLGLLLLLAAVAMPLLAAVLARGEPGVTPAVAGFTAAVVHTGIDWDFQIVAVTLVGLFSGAALLVVARPDTQPFHQRWSVRAPLAALLIALVATAIAIQAGNSALARGSSALDEGNAALAARLAHRAHDWQPWSFQPWQLLGQAYLGAGRTAEARHSFNRAIALDRANWSLWYDLAQASRGTARVEALAQAARLNPRSPELQALGVGR